MYIADIVIHSQTWEEHLIWVEAVLQALRDAGLTANPTKCRLGLEEAHYLGHVVGRVYIKPQTGKVVFVFVFVSTVVQVLNIIAVSSRNCLPFIPNFANRTAPLHGLTRKTQPNQVQLPSGHRGGLPGPAGSLLPGAGAGHP